MRWGTTLRLACALAALALASCGDWAERERARRAEVGGPGAVLYLTYCESCHGPTGAGDGRAAASLRVRPVDLTRLWESYGSPLDRENLAAYIDGRGLLSYHESDMPVWGEEFFPEVPPNTGHLEDVRRRLIDSIIDHLETLQSGPAQ